MASISFIQTLTSLTCWACGIYFAMPDVTERKRQEDGKTFFCPNGCRISYGPSLLEQAKRRAKAAEARAVHAEDQRVSAERSAAAFKGQATKMRKRIGNGVCPCCNRHFADVERHMNSKHPGYAAAEVTETS